MEQNEPDSTAVQFEAAEVRQILSHLNRCHAVSNLRLAQLAVSNDPAIDPGREVVRAWMAGLDGHGVDFLAESATGPLVLHLQFEWPAANLAAACEELRRLYRTASRPAPE